MQQRSSADRWQLIHRDCGSRHDEQADGGKDPAGSGHAANDPTQGPRARVVPRAEA
jgi:hypothetical protein